MSSSRGGVPARLAIGLAVSAVCVYIVTRHVEWQPLRAAMSRVDGRWLAAGAAVNVAAFAAAALRWRRLVDRQVRLSALEAFDSLMIGNVTNLVVPTRLGDVMRAVLVARRGHARVTAVLASVVVERVADLLMLLVFAGALSSVIAVPTPIAVAVRALAGVTAAAIVLFMVAADRIAPLIKAVIGLTASALADRIGEQIDSFVVELRAAGGAGRVRQVILWSATAWLLWGLSASCSVRAFGLPVPWYGGFFVMTVVNLGGLVPASPGAIGVYHYLATLALSVWVSDAALALAFAIVSHAVALGVVIILGILSVIREGVSLRSWPAVTATPEAPRL